MESKYSVLLPGDVRLQVAEIEELTRNPVNVRPQRANESDLHDATYATIHMVCGVTKTEIIYPVQRGMARAALIHEIQHLYRNTVLGIEALESRDTRSGDKHRQARILDNDLEHLFIIPIELKYVPDGQKYWEIKYEQSVRAVSARMRMPIRNANEALALRCEILRHWLLASRILPVWSGLSALELVLKKTDLWRDAQNLLVAIDDVFPDKIRCIQKLFRFTRLGADDFRLLQYQVDRRRILFRDIPPARLSAQNPPPIQARRN